MTWQGVGHIIDPKTLFLDKTIKLCLSFAKRRRWEASLHTVRTSVLWWRSGVMKDNADNWSFVWRTSSPKYHSGKVSSQLLMLRHPPLGDLVFPSRDVLTAFAKTSASRKPSLRCFRRSTLGFPATSLLYSSTVSTASLSGENICAKLLLLGQQITRSPSPIYSIYFCGMGAVEYAQECNFPFPI